MHIPPFTNGFLHTLIIHLRLIPVRQDILIDFHLPVHGIRRHIAVLGRKLHPSKRLAGVQVIIRDSKLIQHIAVIIVIGNVYAVLQQDRTLELTHGCPSSF